MWPEVGNSVVALWSKWHPLLRHFSLCWSLPGEWLESVCGRRWASVMDRRSWNDLGLVVGSVLAVVVCVLIVRQARLTSLLYNQGATEAKGEPQEGEFSQRDRDVLRSVANDLLRNREFQPARTGTQIVLVPYTPRSYSDQAGFEALSPSWRQALADIRRRNRGSIPIPDIIPNNKSVVMRSLTSREHDIWFYQSFPNARGWFQSWLPGYSLDGHTCIVLFLCGPHLHSAHGTYVLVKKDISWDIYYRYVIYGP
jgi:hypothetical protein